MKDLQGPNANIEDFHSSHFFHNSTIGSLFQNGSMPYVSSILIHILSFHISLSLMTPIALLRYLLSLISAVRELERFAVGRARVRGHRSSSGVAMGFPASAGMETAFFRGGCFENGLSYIYFRL